MNKCIILAAGAGTRMKSKHPKVMHQILGEPMLYYVLEAAKGMDYDKAILVLGHGHEEVASWAEGMAKVEHVLQPVGEDAPYGTGFAAMQALPAIEDGDKVLILCGDTPLIREETIEEFVEYHEAHQFSCLIMSAVVKDPTGYGRILRDGQGRFFAIREEKDCNDEEKMGQEINGGVYLFTGKALKEGLAFIDDDNAQGEYYLTDVAEILLRRGHAVEAYQIASPEELDGINSRLQLAHAEKAMRRRINEYWMKEGITFIDPDRTTVGPKVTLGTDITLWPEVVLQGETVIGEGTTVLGVSRIENSIIGKENKIDSSLIEASVVGDASTIGPFAHLRPKAKLGNRVKVGNFVEVKNATMKEGSKASHLAYVGDAMVGERVNIGCGVIFVNYDGKHKFESAIEDDAFIGSNVNVVAPVHVGKGAFVAAGSTITHDVAEDTLTIARCRETYIENWSKRRAEKEMEDKA